MQLKLGSDYWGFMTISTSCYQFSLSLWTSKFTHKCTFSDLLLTLVSFQTCMTFFLLLNTKDILKNDGDQAVLVPIDFHWIVKKYDVSQLESEPVWWPTFFKISNHIQSHPIILRLIITFGENSTDTGQRLNFQVRMCRACYQMKYTLKGNAFGCTLAYM